MAQTKQSIHTSIRKTMEQTNPMCVHYVPIALIQNTTSQLLFKHLVLFGLLKNEKRERDADTQLVTTLYSYRFL